VVASGGAISGGTGGVSITGGSGTGGSGGGSGAGGGGESPLGRIGGLCWWYEIRFQRRPMDPDAHSTIRPVLGRMRGMPDPYETHQRAAREILAMRQEARFFSSYWQSLTIVLVVVALVLWLIVFD
jgi:hypothetical protein